MGDIKMILQQYYAFQAKKFRFMIIFFKALKFRWKRPLSWLKHTSIFVAQSRAEQDNFFLLVWELNYRKGSRE